MRAPKLKEEAASSSGDASLEVEMGLLALLGALRALSGLLNAGGGGLECQPSELAFLLDALVQSGEHTLKTYTAMQFPQ